MARPEPLQPIGIGEKPTRKAALIAINEAIRRYNLTFPTVANQRERDRHFVLDGRMVGLLDSIYVHCIAYLLMRPMSSRSARGEARVMACANLTLALRKHAKFFDIRFLRGDLDPDKAGGMNYWLERHDQRLMGEEIFNEFLVWVANNPAKQPFGEFMADATSELQYFTDLNRDKHEIHFEGKTILTHDGELLTTDSEGAFSGLSDSFIYVCSARTRKIYSGRSERGVVHHSSFLRGEPIIAGGDWVVTRGKLKFLNAASGHYRPTAGNMRQFLQLYVNQLDYNAFVQPTHKGPIYRIVDYLKLGEKATPSAEGARFVADRTP